MLKLWDLSSKFAKTNVRFESSTFEIEYMQNFVKIRKLILFGPKYPKIHLESKFRKRKPVENSKFSQF